MTLFRVGRPEKMWRGETHERLETRKEDGSGPCSGIFLPYSASGASGRYRQVFCNDRKNPAASGRDMSDRISQYAAYHVQIQEQQSKSGEGHQKRRSDYSPEKRKNNADDHGNLEEGR